MRHIITQLYDKVCFIINFLPFRHGNFDNVRCLFLWAGLIQTALNGKVAAAKTAGDAGNATYTYFSNFAVTVDGTDKTQLNIAYDETVRTYTPAAGGATIDVKATDKFKGDIADVNNVNFDMVLGGKSIDISVTGIAPVDTGDNIATALKTGIDAALANYATARAWTLLRHRT